MKISKNKKSVFFSHVSTITHSKSWVPWSKSVLSSSHTDRQIHTKVNTEDTLSWFQESFLQPIIKDWSNKK